MTPFTDLQRQSVRAGSSIAGQVTSNMQRTMRWPGALKLLLVFSAALLIAWSLVVPVFESPDEPAHWQYARYIHDHWQLPVYQRTIEEGNQAPLYYLLIAPFAANSTLPSMLHQLETVAGHALVCPPRVFSKCPREWSQYWPVRTARLFTACLSVLTILFVYFAALEATLSHRTAILAGVLTICLPQFAFRGANISNDAMLATTSALATYCILRLLRRGFTWQMGCVASVAVALAFLSKISGMIFVPVLVGVILCQRVDWHARFSRLAVLLVAAVCVAPWTVRNQMLYGDPLASKAMLQVMPFLVYKKSVFSPYFKTTFPTVLWRSFIGSFGWMNVGMPTWVYNVFAVIGCLAIVGFLWVCWKHAISNGMAIVLIILPVLALLSVIQLNLTFSQPQGRYLFAGLPALMITVAIGLAGLPGWNTAAHRIAISLLVGISIYALLKVELPAYWTRKSITPQTVLDTNIPPEVMLNGAVGPLTRGGQFGQTFTARGPNLSAVEVEIANYGKPSPAGFIRVHLRQSVASQTDMAIAAIPAARIPDCSFAKLSFAPIKDSQGKSYYVFIDTEGISGAYPITVFASKTDVYSGGELFINGAPTGRDTAFHAYDTMDASLCTNCGN